VCAYMCLSYFFLPRMQVWTLNVLFSWNLWYDNFIVGVLFMPSFWECQYSDSLNM
jgi:hypothetical protein